MPELSIETLPLLPLTSGVVLPGMVVTATLETPESRAAASAAEEAGGQLLLVPKVDGRYARVGTVAKIEDTGELPNGQLAAVVRGLHRARVETGVAGTGEATGVQVEPLSGAPPSGRAAQLAREYRAVVENILEARGARQVAEVLRGISDPGQIADTAVYSPDLSFERKVEVLETLDVEQRLEKVLAWALDTLAELPWGVKSQDALDIGEARRVLDEDHTGLEDVKDRILEYLAVRKLRRERGLVEQGRGAGAIIALVGPPGVGKTSLGESVARAMGRKFVRVALGGIRDEAEIRGHRRTYVG